MPQTVYIALLASMFIGCWSAVEEEVVPEPESVWSVDLIRTLADAQSEYVGNVRDNWAQARRIALTRGDVTSFRALIAESDSSREWDIILMTEYRDSVSWANREEIFREIFESSEFVGVPTVRPSSELRAFVAGGVVLKELVSDAKVHE